MSGHFVTLIKYSMQGRVAQAQTRQLSSRQSYNKHSTKNLPKSFFYFNLAREKEILLSAYRLQFSINCRTDISCSLMALIL